MDVTALQLMSRFALTPNVLGYCGKDTAPEKFKKCIISGDCTGVEEEISKFMVLYSYLKTISQITKLPTHSYPIAEGYWLGNDQLKRANPQHYEKLLENFAETGVPKLFIEELRQNQPKAFIPHHLFQVLHIGVGRASNAVPFNLNSINNCMIRWGVVEKVAGNTATIGLNSLKKNGTKYELTSNKETLPFEQEFVPKLKVGDTVAVHWKQVIKILSENETTNLARWTKKILETIAC